MRNRLPFLSGLALATLGVSGLAGGGLLWNFQGRTLGLGSTVTALVLLGISFVLLRPEPRLSPVEVPEASQPLKVKAPQASFLGLMLAILGTFGMAGSGLLWNFQGLAFGLTGTLTARRCSFAESGFSVAPRHLQGQNISQDRAGGDHRSCFGKRSSRTNHSRSHCRIAGS